MNERAKAPDSTLVAAVLAGDIELFGVLIERYRKEFGRYAASLVGDPDVAADAMQEAFIRAFDSLASCRDPSRFKAWFFRILTNRCHNHRGRRLPTTDRLPDTPARDRPDLDLARAELAQVLERAIDTLTPKQREAFVLRHVEGRSYAEIAELLSVGEDALKMRVYRARDALRKQLEAYR